MVSEEAKCWQAGNRTSEAWLGDEKSLQQFKEAILPLVNPKVCMSSQQAIPNQDGLHMGVHRVGGSTCSLESTCVPAGEQINCAKISHCRLGARAVFASSLTKLCCENKGVLFYTQIHKDSDWKENQKHNVGVGEQMGEW